MPDPRPWITDQLPNDQEIAEGYETLPLWLWPHYPGSKFCPW
jgi:hypothetical protein